MIIIILSVVIYLLLGFTLWLLLAAVSGNDARHPVIFMVFYPILLFADFLSGRS